MSTLHITNGDCVATTLRQFIGDPVMISADVLFEGPAPSVPDGTWYELRSQFLAATAPGQADRIRRELEAADRILDNTAGCDEVVLWFEHDLFDQLNLIRTLDRIHRSARGAPTALICVDRFPGVERFIGLGQLGARQLSRLATEKQPVSEAQFELASRAWQAFRAPDPSELIQIAADGASALPFLAGSLQRFCAEYPSAANGLSQTAQHLLEALAAGPHTGGVLFRTTQEREPSPFMGDTTFFDTVRRLATARVPLVCITPDDGRLDLHDRDVSLTTAGREVLSGRDAVALSGIAEWRGGVHLRGTSSSPWRWDGSRKTLVSWA